LPQETFYSSGATVKASLLFLQKFTLGEKANFEHQGATAATEIQTKYVAQIAVETQRIKAVIEAAKGAGDVEKRKAAQKELSNYAKNMEAQTAMEARALFKERVDYPVFMYEAEYVGIKATGEVDFNELYPNDNQPPSVEKTCLNWYQEFQKNTEYLAEKG
jgi:type I restriction enzyme M protein